MSRAGFVIWSLAPSRSGCAKYGTIEAKDGERFLASNVIRFELMQDGEGTCELYADVTNPPARAFMFVHIETLQSTRLKDGVDAAAEWLDARGLAERQKTMPDCCPECGELIEEDWIYCALCGAEIYTIWTKGGEDH